MTDKSSLWEIRTEEQQYAFLQDKQHKDTNHYGHSIDLLIQANQALPENRPLYINDNSQVGTNPNRNKQHGFYFTADNCIGCHACEAACAEKNETPPHLAFRSVGYVEGGSYPDYARLNISMACNHCDDPVCLKGCPTRAYTKHAEYGAVLQDPDTCFGCGYCTWVCPYNAPQLDPVQGQVSKCNMCVDRLEVGLKPACVAACVGNALDFGVIENVPANREQAKLAIPGFPDPEITHPNIRFQQIRSLPDEMTRTDSMPVKYHKNERGEYKPAVDKAKINAGNGDKMYWNFRRLSSRENPLVLFTLLTQAAIGGVALTFLAAFFNLPGFAEFKQSAMYAPLMILSCLLVAGGLFLSTTHLGKPLRFYRGFNNLRYSPVCREGLGIALFLGLLTVHILLSLPANTAFQSLCYALFAIDIVVLINKSGLATAADVCAWLALAAGAGGLYYMVRCYRIKARPFWNHWQVATAFFGSSLSLGALLAGSLIVISLAAGGLSYEQTLRIAAAVMLGGIALEAFGLFFHARAMNAAEHEGAAAHYVQLTTFGRIYRLRNGLLAANLALITGLLLSGSAGVLAFGWSIAAIALTLSAVMGRALFYVLVIPTTMPGAFFWKNKDFEQHARDIGLAQLPQVGIAPGGH